MTKSHDSALPFMANAAAVAGLDQPAAPLALATTRIRGTRNASKQMALWDVGSQACKGEGRAQNFI